jgi:hypothetical protein
VGTANRRDWVLVPLGAIGPGCHAEAEDAAGDGGAGSLQ